MSSKSIFFRIVIFLFIFIFTFSGSFYEEFDNEFALAKEKALYIDNLYKDYSVSETGTNITGVLNKINTTEKIIALTFDACGGKRGSKADVELIDYLINNNIKATFFINIRWINRNRDVFNKISNNPLFDIENHGLKHRPLLVTDKEIYGISSTGSVKNVVKEVETAALIIEKLTFRKPLYFRSGTAYYDNVSIDIVNTLGYKIAGFSISADYGGILSSKEIKKNILKAKSGDIILSHINQPKKGIKKAFIEALPILKKNGFSFVKLSEVDLIGK